MISIKAENYNEWDGVIPRTSGLVCLTRTLFNGDSTEEWMTPANAVSEALFCHLNGGEIRSSRIIWGIVSSGTLDASGSGFSAEVSTIRHLWDYTDD